MPTPYSDLSSDALADLIDDNLIAKSISFPRFFKGHVSGPNPVWFITGEALPGNNGVAMANLTGRDPHLSIEQILHPFKEQNLRVTWWVGPRSQPGNLGVYLQMHGFRHNRDMIGMAADLNSLHISERAQSLDFTLKPVINRKDLEAWYEIILQCFPTARSESYLNALEAISFDPKSGWYHYLGLLDGQPVAASSICTGAGVAGLYNLGTIPSARKSGVGSRITYESYIAARDMGYSIGTLQTTYPNALRMYHRMGFEVYCKIGIYNTIP